MRYACRLVSLLVIAPTVFLVLVLQGEALQLSSSRRPVVGVAPALVVDVSDPEAMGRIKVRFPWIRAGANESWARVTLPLGGNMTGLWSLPEIDEEVLVSFEQGDLERPIVLGSLWNGAARPPGGASLTSPNGRFSITVTDSGVTLRGPNAVVQLDATEVVVNAENTRIASNGQTSIASGGFTNINGGVVRLNGSGCPPVARVGDLVRLGELLTIFTGSPTVTSC